MKKRLKEIIVYLDITHISNYDFMITTNITKPIDGFNIKIKWGYIFYALACLLLAFVITH